MARLRVFLSRLVGFSSGNTRDADLRTEIDAHIAEAADEYVRQGLTKEDARRAALRQFGGVTQTIEDWLDIHALLCLYVSTQREGCTLLHVNSGELICAAGPLVTSA